MRDQKSRASSESRSWYALQEIECIMDAARESVPESAFVPLRGICVDALAAHACQAEIVAGQLPPNVLGAVAASGAGSFVITLEEQLARAARHSTVARRRLRATIAHECAHVLLHRERLAGRADVGVASPATLCRTPSVEPSAAAQLPRSHGDPLEFQANRGMSALLLPRNLFESELDRVLLDNGMESFSVALCFQREKPVVQALANVFDVNPIMILLRLQALDLQGSIQIG